MPRQRKGGERAAAAVVVKPRPDWAEIKRQYVEGVQVDGKIANATCDELAAAHGVNASNVRDRAGKEGWRTEREIFQAKAERARQEKRVQVLAADGAQFDADALRIAKGALVAIGRKVGEILGKPDAPRAVSREDVDVLRGLGSAARHFHAIGKASLGEPADLAPPPAQPAGPQAPSELRVTIVRDGPAASDDDDD